MSRAPIWLILTLAGLAVLAAAWSQWPEKGLPPDSRVDRVVIHKSARRLSLFRDGTLLKTYRVALGSQPQGPKACQGDGRTPEGLYRIAVKNRQSRYHLSLGISYPGPADRKGAQELGCPPGVGIS